MRTLVLIDAFVGLLFAPFSFIFIFRINIKYGIPDVPLLLFSEVVQETLSMAFIFLPLSVLFAKICPKHIEATCFALLAGISNFKGTFRGWIGSIINDNFVKVSKDDLSKYWVLVVI